MAALDFAGVLTQATSTLVGQSQQQGGVQAVVDGKASAAQVRNGGSGVSWMGDKGGCLVLTAASGQTEQPRDLKPDHQEKKNESPRLQGWNFRHGRGFNE